MNSHARAIESSGLRRRAHLREVSEPTPRSGENNAVPFRSSRFFCVGNRWYFTTREGFDSGPYANRDRAETGLKRFLQVVQMLPEQHRSRRL